MAETLQREIDSFDVAQPEEDARRNIAAGDHRVLAVQGYGISFPGLPNDAQLSIADSDKFRLIQGTTDFVVGEKHRELIHIAHRYAERYNSYVLASGTLGV